jgi:hypothetical protein
MSPEQQINLKNTARINIVVSLGTLVGMGFILMQLGQIKSKAEDYLNRAVLVDDMREWEYANRGVLKLDESMDAVHRNNHDTRPRFK